MESHQTEENPQPRIGAEQWPQRYQLLVPATGKCHPTWLSITDTGIKDKLRRRGDYPGLSERALNAITNILERETEGDVTYTEAEGRVPLEAETGLMQTQAKEHLEPQELEEAGRTAL